MKLKEYDILIDLKKHKQIEDIEVVAGDFGSNILNINIVEGVETYELTSLNVEIAFVKSDGTTVLQDLSNGIELIGNKIKCILSTNTIAIPGTVLAEVRILEGVRLLTTARFKFHVRKAIVNDETIISTNEFPILNRLVNDVETLSDQIQREEDIRIQNESTRQTNTTNAINNVGITNTAFKVWENYDNAKDYVPMNKVQYQGSSYVNIVACKGILPINTENWQLVAAKGLDGDNFDGVLTKAVYDTNDNGKVDIAENAEKLNGIPATDYATRAYTDEQIGLITETGIPKYLEYEYKIIGLIGQSKFDIPLETFDSNTDSIDLFVNTTYWERTKYIITNKTGVTLGFITLNTPLEEDKNIVIKVKKNVPMGAEGSTSGNVLADGSVEDRKLTDKTVDDTVVPLSGTNAGKLGDVLNWFGNMLKNITGKSSWKDKPTKNLEELNNDLSSHKAEMVSQVDGIHGLKIETGSWTPEFANSLNTTYTKQAGRYVKTNSKVYISFELQVSNLGSFTGQPTIKGIPFKPNPQTVLNIGLHEGIDISDVGDSLCGSLLLENLIQFTVSKKNGGALSVLASTAIKSNFRIYGQATYLI